MANKGIFKAVVKRWRGAKKGSTYTKYFKSKQEMENYLRREKKFDEAGHALRGKIGRLGTQKDVSKRLATKEELSQMSFKEKQAAAERTRAYMSTQATDQQFYNMVKNPPAAQKKADDLINRALKASDYDYAATRDYLKKRIKNLTRPDSTKALAEKLAGKSGFGDVSAVAKKRTSAILRDDFANSTGWGPHRYMKGADYSKYFGY